MDRARLLNPKTASPLLKLRAKDHPGLTAFMQDFYALTTGNPFSRDERVWQDSVAIECSPFEGKIHLSSIRSFAKGKGNASRALAVLCNLADKHGVAIACDASPFGTKDMTEGELTAWYERNGFQWVDGDGLVRMPSNSGTARDQPEIVNETKPRSERLVLTDRPMMEIPMEGSEPDMQGIRGSSRQKASYIRRAAFHKDPWEGKKPPPSDFDPGKVKIRQGRPHSGKEYLFQAFYGSQNVGYAMVSSTRDDDHPKDERTMWNTSVDPNWQRKGIATKLYDAAEAYLTTKGLKLVPGIGRSLHAVSDDAYELWKKRRPEDETVRNDPRWHQQQYRGKPVEYQGETWYIANPPKGKYCFLQKNDGSHRSAMCPADLVYELYGRPGEPKQAKVAALSASGRNKAVDESGSPLLLWHGTDAEFDTFEDNLPGGGFTAFFTEDKALARSYGGILYPAHLTINRPAPYAAVFAAAREAGIDEGALEDEYPGIILNMDVEVSNILRAKGYDGWIGMDSSSADVDMEEAMTYVVFSPGQIEKVSQSSIAEPASDDLSKEAGKKPWLGLALAPMMMGQTPHNNQPSASTQTPFTQTQTQKSMPNSWAGTMKDVPEDYKSDDLDDRRDGHEPSAGEKAWDLVKETYRDSLQDFDNRTQDDLEKELNPPEDLTKKHSSHRSKDGAVKIDSKLKAWFAGSKIVDGSGNPLLVYHGSSENFKEFKGGSIHFTDQRWNAKGYATGYQGSGSGHIYSAYLYMEKPIDLRDPETTQRIYEETGEWIDTDTVLDPDAMAELDFSIGGYDGIITLHESGGGARDGSLEYIVFDAAQVWIVKNEAVGKGVPEKLNENDRERLFPEPKSEEEAVRDGIKVSWLLQPKQASQVRWISTAPRGVVNEFTRGGCFALAIALHRKYNLPMYGAYAPLTEPLEDGVLDAPHHVFVKQEDSVVDIRGSISLDHLVSGSSAQGGTVGPIADEAELLERIGGYFFPDEAEIKLAGRVAGKYLRKVMSAEGQQRTAEERSAKADSKERPKKAATLQEQIAHDAEAYEDQWSGEAHGHPYNVHPAYVEAKDLLWKDEPNFDLGRISGYKTDGDFWKWMREETLERAHESFGDEAAARKYVKDMEGAIRDHSIEHIFVAEGIDGQFYLWDGNHRVGVAEGIGAATIPAYVGYRADNAHTAKTAFISPRDAELTVAIESGPRAQVTLGIDLGIPNFTQFTLTFPTTGLVNAEISVFSRQALRALLDDIGAFMLSMKYDEEQVVEVTSLAEECFHEISDEDATDVDDADWMKQDTSIRMYEKSFKLPESFAEETLTKVVTAGKNSHPDVLYHSADPKYREDIRRHGLDGTKGHSYDEGNGPPSVYFDSIPGAEPDVWEVDVRGLPIEEDEAGMDAIYGNPEWEGHTWWVLWGSVPPNRLRLLPSGKKHNAITAGKVQRTPETRHLELHVVEVPDAHGTPANVIQFYRDQATRSTPHPFEIVVHESLSGQKRDKRDAKAWRSKLIQGKAS